MHAIYKLLMTLNIWKLPKAVGGGPETEVTLGSGLNDKKTEHSMSWKTKNHNKFIGLLSV